MMTVYSDRCVRCMRCVHYVCCVRCKVNRLLESVPKRSSPKLLELLKWNRAGVFMRMLGLGLGLGLIASLCFGSAGFAQAQGTVDVLFRYSPEEGAVRSFVPGSFNNWGNNSSGVIQPWDGSLMTPDATIDGYPFSYKVITLPVGGGETTVGGSSGYTYKFHEHRNSSGSSYVWLADPLNATIVGEYGNSFVEITHPMIFQTEPADGALVNVDPPALVAFVGGIAGDPIDAGESEVRLNGVPVGAFSSFYDAERELLYVPASEVVGPDGAGAGVADGAGLAASGLVAGENTLTIRAVTESGATREQVTSFTYLAPEVVDAPRPAGIEDGITVSDGDLGTVTFSLFAPGKEYVHVVGDHSNWQVDDAYLMKRDAVRADSVHFWLTIDGFTPGEYARFQYLVDGEIAIADPYSELVLDPFHDPYVPEGRFPGMPAYPDGALSGLVSVFQPGAAPYNWQVPDFDRPAPEELVIYELLLRDFVEESSFDVLADTLEYLQRLGVNAIGLMPVAEFDGNLSWGYNPMMHGALDKYYGSPNAFKALVDAAHLRGMAVILDVVYNHAHERSPLIELYGANRSTNRFIGPGHAFNVFQHLNHDDPYIRYWLDRMNRYWLEEYNIDGFRFDLSKGFATNVDNPSNLQGPNPQRIANLKRMYYRLRETDPTAYVILEHFADGFEEQQLEQAGMMLWGNHNYNYAEAAQGYHDGGKSDFSGIYFGNRGFVNPHLVGYMESHDEQWLMRKMKLYGNSSNPSHNIQELDTALERQKLNGAFFFTIPGPKMMWQFGELGYGWGAQECLISGDGNGDCSASDPPRTGEKPVRWEYAEQANRRALYDTWSELMRLRRSSPVFTSPETAFSSFLSGETKWIRLQHEDMDVVIIGNFDVVQRDRQISFSQAGTWYEYLSDTTIEVPAGNLSSTFTLDPAEFMIFTSEPVQDVLPITATPQFDLEPGTYTESVTLSITSQSEGASIYYTLNGEEPSNQSELYTGPLVLNSSAEVKAIAVKDGFENSAVQEGIYRIVEFSLTLNVADTFVRELDLTIGTAADATRGYDELYDRLAPPPPPDGAFDARIRVDNVSYFNAYLPGVSSGGGTGGGANIEWQISFEPSSGYAPATLRWDPVQLPPTGTFYLKDLTGGAFVSVDLRTQTQVTVEEPFITDLILTYQPGATNTTIQQAYPASWNLVSLPVLSSENNVQDLFPTATEGSLYRFEGNYLPADHLTPGEGYWLRFDEQTVVDFSGSPVTQQEVDVALNWNLIGSLSVPAMIQDDQNLIVPGTLYGFNGSYQIADQIESGLGYWVATSGDGSVKLMPSDGISATSLQHPLRTPEILGKFHTVRFVRGDADATSAIGAIYFGGDFDRDVHPLQTQLPPVPPAGSFDVRMEGDTWITENENVQMRIQVPQAIEGEKNDGEEDEGEGEDDEGPIFMMIDGPGNFHLAGDLSVVGDLSVAGNHSAGGDLAGNLTTTSEPFVAGGPSASGSSTHSGDHAYYRISFLDAQLQSLAPAQGVRAHQALEVPDHAAYISAEVLSHQPETPTAVRLHPNYPNPFNPSTQIAFDLPEASIVTLEVFDVLGRRVAVLEDGWLDAGSFVRTFDASGLSGGVYVVRLSVRDASVPGVMGELQNRRQNGMQFTRSITLVK